MAHPSVRPFLPFLPFLPVREPPQPPAARGTRDRSLRASGKSPRQLREGSPVVDANVLEKLRARTAAWNAAHPNDLLPAPVGKDEPNGKAPTRSHSDTDFDAGLVTGEIESDDWIGGGQ